MMCIISAQIVLFQRRTNLFLSFKLMDPKEFFINQCNGLELNMPDITLRYLAVKDLVNGVSEDGRGIELYKKFFQGIGDDSDIFLGRLKILVNSFADHGYNSDFSLTSDRRMRLVDGAHRLSCALFFGEKTIRVRSTITSNCASNYYDISNESRWTLMIDAGLSDEDIDYIRHESDLLVESVINEYIKVNDMPRDREALRKWVVEESKKVYGLDGSNFYQSLPMLGVNGTRPTDKRIAQYGLKDLLNAKMDVLDIGCNIGFMDMEIASLVRSVTGIELGSGLSRLSKKIASKLNIYNTTFVCADFKEWKNISRRKYDMIFSFANYRWIGLNAQEYVTKIASNIKHGGYVFFEGHDIISFSDEQKEYGDYIDAFIKNGFSCIKFGDSTDQESIQRIWTLLQYTGQGNL